MAKRDTKRGRATVRQEITFELSYHDELERMLGEEVRRTADGVQSLEWGAEALIESCTVSAWVTSPALRPVLVDGPAVCGLVCSPDLPAGVFSVVQAAITLYSRVRFELLNRQDQAAIARLAPADHWAGPGLPTLLEAIREVSDGAQD